MADRKINLTASDIERFWSKVDKSAGPDGCWPWTAAKLEPGYGIFMTKGGITLRAPRISLSLKLKRQIKSGYYACHKCDNPPCVNQRHLFEGTNQHNLLDASSKKRCAVHRHPEIVRGSRNPAAKLTEDQVRFIRSSGMRTGLLAIKFGVSRTTIKTIRHPYKNRGWQHVK